MLPLSLTMSVVCRSFAFGGYRAVQCILVMDGRSLAQPHTVFGWRDVRWRENVVLYAPHIRHLRCLRGHKALNLKSNRFKIASMQSRREGFGEAFSSESLAFPALQMKVWTSTWNFGIVTIGFRGTLHQSRRINWKRMWKMT